MESWFLLGGAGFLGGAMNALAGGGSFVTLSALVAAGVPSVSANATSSVALYPGGALSVFVYRKGLGEVGGVPLRPSLAATVAGGFVGAMLLLLTSNGAFDRILPWLLLAATVTLILGPRLGAVLRRHFRAGPILILSLQFALGVYGGYFGGAVGLMMMAAWSLIDSADVKRMAPARTLMVTGANTIAVLCFALAGAVAWLPALLVGIGALAGGYVGARLGRILPATVVRGGTIALAVAMTIAFFLRGYLGVSFTKL
ncbi:MAG: hypothetical protein JWN07_3091 [Hyphomicrobiales bacterium]|nr:hypothetical protein [Hyphomicrobiales bacterium]